MYLYFYLYANCPGGDDSSSNDSDSEDCEEWISLYAKIQSESFYEATFHIELSILKENGEKFISKFFHEKLPSDCSWGYSKFIRQADLDNPVNNLLPDDTLTICCRIQEMTSGSGPCTCPAVNRQIVQTRSKMAPDFASFFFPEDWSLVMKNTSLSWIRDWSVWTELKISWRKLSEKWKGGTDSAGQVWWLEGVKFSVGLATLHVMLLTVCVSCLFRDRSQWRLSIQQPLVVFKPSILTDLWHFNSFVFLVPLLVIHGVWAQNFKQHVDCEMIGRVVAHFHFDNSI